MKYWCVSAVLLGIVLGLNAQTIRIMPLGNSITWDENSLDASNPRSDGVRISYRYKLFQLMNAAGYDFDYVGSENTGISYFGDAEFDDNAGFPGIETWQLEDLINTGYNAMTGSNESPGPYLNYFPADIILLHIGTNALIQSAYQVEDLLDRIRNYDSDVLILVAKIINRRTYHASTTTFNNNVESMVTGRGDPNIKMVNIETGADINYNEDMIDNLHPNQTGYNKMAFKWFEAIQNLNSAPVISQISEQFTSRNTAFSTIDLDNFVTDNEDPAEAMTWTFTRKLGSQLNVSVDADRVLSVSPNNNWYGSELLTLKVEDTGNGLFPASHTINVIFTVTKENDPPTIESDPTTEVNQEEYYSYTIQAYDVDGDPMSFSAIQMPSWLSFNESTHQLSGTPHVEDIGLHNITLRVSDPTNYTDQVFQLEVLNVNIPPQITSTAVTEVLEDGVYYYNLKANDPDGDILTYSAPQIPDWLTFDLNSQSLSGLPVNEHVGTHSVILRVSDGYWDTDQDFELTVVNENDPPAYTTDPLLEIHALDAYVYKVEVEDVDPGDILTFSTLEKPDWLTLAGGTTEALLFGTPTKAHVGSHSVIIQVSDGIETEFQGYTLKVLWPTDIRERSSEDGLSVYPNPAVNVVHFEFENPGNTILSIYNGTGSLMKTITSDFEEQLEVNISDLERGVYYYKAIFNGHTKTGKLIKN